MLVLHIHIMQSVSIVLFRKCMRTRAHYHMPTVCCVVCYRKLIQFVARFREKVAHYSSKKHTHTHIEPPHSTRSSSNRRLSWSTRQAAAHHLPAPPLRPLPPPVRSSSPCANRTTHARRACAIPTETVASRTSHLYRSAPPLRD